MHKKHVLRLIWALIFGWIAINLFVPMSLEVRALILFIFFVTMLTLLFWFDARIFTQPITYGLNSLSERAMLFRRWQTSINLTTKALQRDETFAPAYRTRGYSYMQLGQFDAAINDFDAALAYGYYRPEVIYFMRSMAHLKVNKTGEAFEDALRAEEEGMSSEWINVLRAHGHFRRHEFDETLHYLKLILERSPNNVAALALLISTYDALGMNEEARNSIQQAKYKAPANAVIRNNSGFNLGKYGEYEEALSDSDKAIDLDPTQAIYYTTRAHTHFLMSSYEAALVDYIKAYKMKPDEKYVLAGYAVIMYALGRQDEALEKWQELQDIPSAEPHTVDSLQADYRWADQFVETLREVETLYQTRYEMGT